MDFIFSYPFQFVFEYGGLPSVEAHSLPIYVLYCDWLFALVRFMYFFVHDKLSKKLSARPSLGLSPELFMCNGISRVFLFLQRITAMVLVSIALVDINFALIDYMYCVHKLCVIFP